jgi:hypothetical protein
VVNATVGKLLNLKLSQYFRLPPSAEVGYKLEGARDWLLSVQNGLLVGIPPGPPEAFFVQIVAKDTYTEAAANFSIESSWAGAPRVLLKGTLLEPTMITSETLDLPLLADIVDPEGGAVEFEARLGGGGPLSGVLISFTQDDSAIAASQQLPSFMQFDARALRFTFNPTSGDRGTYLVRVWGTTEYGPRRTSAYVSFTLTVVLSWIDFFDLLWTTAGYMAPVITALGSLWLLRLRLYKVLMTRRYLRPAPPDEFLAGVPYTLRSPHNEAKIQHDCVINARVLRLQNRPHWPDLPFRYWKLRQRKPEETLQDDAVQSCGVSWITVLRSSDGVETKVDVELLRELIGRREVEPEDEYLFKVMGRAMPKWLWPEVPLEWFVFSSADILAHLAETADMAAALEQLKPGGDLLLDAVQQTPSASSPEEVLMDVLETRIATQKGQTRISAQDTRIEAQIDTLRALVETLQSQIGVMQAQSTSQEAKIGVLQAQNTSQEAKIGVLQTQNTSQEAKICALQAQVNSHDAVVSAVQKFYLIFDDHDLFEALIESQKAKSDPPMPPDALPLASDDNS